MVNMARLKIVLYVTFVILTPCLLAVLALPQAHGGVNLLKSLRDFIDPALPIFTVPYGPDPEEIVDIVRPKSPMPFPAVILIHGGGWSAGKKEDMGGEAQRLAKAGFTVINISYRLGKQDDVRTHWPAQLQDAQLAVRWARAHASTLGLDPKRICAMGGSAGGQLAMELGYLKESAPGDRADSFKEQSPTVDCVINICGPANITHPEFIKGLKNVGLQSLPFLGNKSVTEAPDLWLSASPLFAIKSDSAPTMLVQARNDSIVPRAIGNELIAKLATEKVPYKFIEVDGDHGLMNTPREQKKMVDATVLEFLNANLRGSQ
jgi:acetyl esterase/lipase